MDEDIDLKINELQRLLSSTTNVEQRQRMKTQINDLKLELRPTPANSITGDNITLDKRLLRGNNTSSSATLRPASARYNRKLSGLLSPVAENLQVAAVLVDSDEDDDSEDDGFSNSDSDDDDDDDTGDSKYDDDDNLLNSLVTSISSPSCYDPHHPPSAALNNSSSYWMTTGMFPQLLVIKLKSSLSVSSVSINTIGVSSVSIITISNSNNNSKSFDVRDNYVCCDMQGTVLNEFIIKVFSNNTSFFASVYGIQIRGRKE